MPFHLPRGLGLDELYAGDDGKKWLLVPLSAACNPRLADLDAVTTARGFPQPGLDVPVLLEGARHVVDRHRAAQLYPAPSPHGDLQSTGLKGWVARRPLAGFLVIVLGLSWLLLCYTGSCLLWRHSRCQSAG